MSQAVEVVNCRDPKRLIPHRIFGVLGLLHWSSGLVFVVIGLCLKWTYAILPAVWFCIGFLWVNAAHLTVADYRYEYKGGRLHIKRIKFGRAKEIAAIDLSTATFEECDDAILATTETPTLWVNNGQQHYALTASPYFAALCKGELDVS